MRELVGKTPDGDCAACLKRFVSCWTDILTSGSVLLTGNLTVRKNEDDFSKFFKEQGLTTLKTLAQQRKKISQADETLDKMEEELTRLGLSDLVTMRLDGQHQRLVAKKEAGEVINVDKDYFHALAFNGEDSWRHKLPQDGDWEAVYKVAKEYILKYLSATCVNTFVDRFKE
ncbi:unnamed protein product, partial [Symbiodinium pilosum]